MIIDQTIHLVPSIIYEAIRYKQKNTTGQDAIYSNLFIFIIDINNLNYIIFTPEQVILCTYNSLNDKQISRVKIRPCHMFSLKTMTLQGLKFLSTTVYPLLFF